jgi:hypothetical protein
VSMAFDRLHHMQLAMPRIEESAARALFVDVLGMVEVEKPPVLMTRRGAWFSSGKATSSCILGSKVSIQAAR